jgi:sugar phosphate isomerase/epimerase
VKLSLNTATVREQWSLAQIIDGCARHGIAGISPWRDQVARMGLAAAARAIASHGLAVTGLCRGGFFTAPDWRDDNRRAIEEAHTLGAQCLVLVVGGLPAGSKDIAGARARVRECLATMLPEARAARVPLAIEPLHPMQAADRACINTLEQALDLCDELGDGIGVAVDVYHVWWDPSVYSEIARASGRILGFHVSDWLAPPPDHLLGRGMMGDGLIELRRLRAAVEEAGYAGPIEVEIFNQRVWDMPPEEALELVKQRFVEWC